MTIRTTFGRLHRAAVWMLLLPVFVYRRVLSPLKRTSTCRYIPTCSEYAIEAVKKRGIVVGFTLAVFRILRCNPLFHGGYHPVSCAHDDHTDHRHGRHAPQEQS